MQSIWRRTVAAATIASLCLQSAAPVLAQQTLASRSDYEACQTQDEATFRRAIQDITLSALKSGTANIDYGALVRDQWRKHNLEAVIDKRVDLAIDAVRSETSWGQLLKSLAYRDKAKELATAVAERVYRSDALKSALEAMSVGVGQDIGKSIEITTTDAARPAQRCLQAFLGPRYGRTVARAVIQDAGAAFVINPDRSADGVSGGAIATNASGAITGAVILLVRRQLARMAQRLGQRVVGSILGRLVAVVAGGIGVVLIAKDVWDLRYGVLPIVAEEMKSEATKEKVREELAMAIKTQIARQLEVLADSTSDRIVDIWRDFKRAHLKVLELAERNTGFKEFVDSARPDQLPRLDEIVGMIAKQEGDQGVMARLANGTLQQAVNKLTPEGLRIARETQSIDQALHWMSLAPDRLDEVLNHELHKRTKPDVFSQTSLNRLLSLDDALVIGRLAIIDRGSRDVLFDLGNEKLVHLARGMEARELDTLAGYITGLEPAARREVMTTVADAPARMRVLASDRVRDAVLTSRDQHAAVKMMLRADKGLDIESIRSDLQMVFDRRISAVLMWDKHPIVVVAAGVALLLLLLILRRILFAPRRPPPSRKAEAA
jgi:hypothetical protein